MTCRLLDGKVGYRGQKYEVRYTRDDEEHVFGWQNERSCGLADAAKMMPGVTAVSVVRVCADVDGNPVATKDVRS